MKTNDLHCDCHLCDGESIHIILADDDGVTEWHYTASGRIQMPLNSMPLELA